MVRKWLRRCWKAGLWLLLVFALYMGGILLYGTLNDFQPEELIDLQAYQPSSNVQIRDSLLSFFIWNVGYGGLGKESDFFFDHGNMFFSGDRMVRPPRFMVEKNVEGIVQRIATTKADFFLLQEVDFKSKRSYYLPQFEMIGASKSGFAAYFAPNYQLPYVPIPLLEPWKAYGAVNSGLGTYTRFRPVDSKRMQLPGSFSWPTSIFQLDR
ncbi:MAG: endonuclease/exonuclease/phosphatase family protein, partial [Saprospiraceae bacterium]|nr:endonuclease/exonuclease/phosphatase family protein [Saprospiraceae bacterium]